MVVADGLTLPFEPLVDWSAASVRIAERDWNALRSLGELRHLLPSDPTVVLEMRHRVCALNAAYMWSEAARRDALFIAAGAHLYIRYIDLGLQNAKLPKHWPRDATDRIRASWRTYAADR